MKLIKLHKGLGFGLSNNKVLTLRWYDLGITLRLLGVGVVTDKLSGKWWQVSIYLYKWQLGIAYYPDYPY